MQFLQVIPLELLIFTPPFITDTDTVVVELISHFRCDGHGTRAFADVVPIRTGVVLVFAFGTDKVRHQVDTLTNFHLPFTQSFLR
jgi:hypothetical protein